jgi:hypothetical protein
MASGAAIAIHQALPRVAAFPFPARSGQVLIRLVTVNEQLLVREELAAIINREQGMELAAEASTGGEAIEWLPRSPSLFDSIAFNDLRQRVTPVDRKE